MTGVPMTTFAQAAALKPPLLEAMDGFISVERFTSVTNPASFCRCRSGAMKLPSPPGNEFHHRQTQRTGRQQLFADYR